MTILTISGSLRAASNTTRLLDALPELASAGVTVSRYEGIDTLPFFSPERDTVPAPPPVAALRAQLRAAEAVVICTPEYAHGMPGVLKNALDWLVGSGELVDKPVATISASPSMDGGSRAHAGLRQTLAVMSARLTDATALTVPLVTGKIDRGTGRVTDQALVAALHELVAAVTAS